MMNRTPQSERLAGWAAMATVGLFVLIADTLYTSDEFEDPIYGNLAYAAMFMVVDLTNRILGAPAARRVVYAAAITKGLLFFEYGDFHMTLVGVSFIPCQNPAYFSSRNV